MIVTVTDQDPGENTELAGAALADLPKFSIAELKGSPAALITRLEHARDYPVCWRQTLIEEIKAVQGSPQFLRIDVHRATSPGRVKTNVTFTISEL